MGNEVVICNSINPVIHKVIQAAVGWFQWKEPPEVLPSVSFVDVPSDVAASSLANKSSVFVGFGVVLIETGGLEEGSLVDGRLEGILDDTSDGASEGDAVRCLGVGTTVGAAAMDGALLVAVVVVGLFVGVFVVVALSDDGAAVVDPSDVGAPVFGTVLTVGAGVGSTMFDVGGSVPSSVGSTVGDLVGALVGDFVGDFVGDLVGVLVGELVGVGLGLGGGEGGGDGGGVGLGVAAFPASYMRILVRLADPS